MSWYKANVIYQITVAQFSDQLLGLGPWTELGPYWSTKKQHSQHGWTKLELNKSQNIIICF